MLHPHFPQPPSDITGPLRDYLVRIAKALDRQPVFSFFSGPTPNSVVTGLPGNFAINLGSVSTTSRLWIKGGSSAISMSRVGWAAVRVLE